MKSQERYIKLFTQLGYGTTEAKLYLTCLLIGPASAILIGRKIGVTRQMVYTLLPILIEKGLIKQVKIGTHRLFHAVDPNILVDIARSNTRELKKVLPELQSKRADLISIPTITIYENLISMREWYRIFMQTAKKGEELLIWSSGNKNHWYDLDKEFYDKFLKFSDDNEIKSTILLPDTPDARKYQSSIGSEKRDHRFIENGWNTNAEKWIWRDQVCSLTIDENNSSMVVVESHAIAELERCGFRSAWKGAWGEISN